MTTFDLRPMRRADAPAVRLLQSAVGRAPDEGTPHEADSHEGARAWVLAAEERILAHCAAIQSAVWIGGEERSFAQVSLPTLDPEHRAALEREGADAALATRMVEAALGPAGDMALQALVHEDDWSAMARLFGLEVVRTPSALFLDVDTVQPPDVQGEGLVELTRFDEQLRWLWDRCASDFGVSAIRDAAFLADRFTGEPSIHHLGLRAADGILRGYATCCIDADGSARRATIVDWLIPPSEPEVGERLVAACVERARTRGASTLGALLPSWSPWFAMFQTLGARVHPTSYVLGARTEVSRYDAFWLRDNWWYQPADFSRARAALPILQP